MLADYPGTVLLVSHDRDFLDRVATSVVTPRATGAGWTMPAAISDMLAQGGRIMRPPARAGAARARASRRRAGSAGGRRRAN